MGIDAALTENTALTTTHYYHSSIKILAKEALSISKNMSSSEVAAQVKNNFFTQLHEALGNIKTPECQTADKAWSCWIDGTWGKCLKELSIACLAKKELSRHSIAEIMQQNPDTISQDSKKALTNAVKNYIAASLDFDAYGTRYLLAEEAIEKFQLDVEIDRKYLKD